MTNDGFKPELPDDEFAWDLEGRHDLAQLEGHVYNSTLYIPSALWNAMKKAWGGVVTAIRTATDTATGEVTVSKAESTTVPGAVKVHVTGAQNTARCSWWRPLHKLQLQVPEDRQFNIPVYTKEARVGSVFVFKMAEIKSVPRNLKENAKKKSASKTAESPAQRTAEAAAAQQPEAPAEPQTESREKN